MANWSKLVCRGLFAPGLLALVLAAPLGARELPANEEALVSQIRAAIETSDYDAMRELVFWKDAGKIKERIVRFELNRSMGRPIKSIEIEAFPENGLDAITATGKFAPNMPVTHTVHVEFDEAPINDAGKLPTSVFLVGMRDDVFRIALVNRAMVDDDD